MPRNASRDPADAYIHEGPAQATRLPLSTGAGHGSSQTGRYVDHVRHVGPQPFKFCETNHRRFGRAAAYVCGPR